MRCSLLLGGLLSSQVLGRIVERQDASSTTTAATAVCTGNTADDRSTWCDYDTSTNYYSDGPVTGETVEYWFELQNVTLSPDGIARNVLTVNGTFPGPTVEANWGDMVVIHVTNGLSDNGSSIHWHGIRQNYTNPHDGVASITQCPIAPGESYTYSFLATQYGSSWYHSHFSLQAWEGVLGPIVIHGPATSNYDVDLGPLVLTDWSHQTSDALYSYAITQGPPTLDNGLLNGTNTYNNSGTVVGSYFSTSWVSGTKYLIRLVNTGIDTYFKFSIDNHTMTVIASDWVPIEPYSTEVLNIGMAQRYDVVVEANQASDNYWIRAVPQAACSSNLNSDNIRGIVRYDSTSTDDPTSIAYDDLSVDECVDEASSNLVPYLSLDVGTLIETDDENLTVALGQANGVFTWQIGSASMDVHWDDPTLLQVYNNDTSWNASEVVIDLGETEEWVYFIISSTLAVPHPIHLHGHDFYVLAQAAGATYNSSVMLSTSNPPRRDVANLPAAGYLVIAFLTDNPGAWLMHCHIGWHTSMGLDLQFVERYSEIAALIDYTTLNDTCSAWDSYQTSSGVVQFDSGV